MSGKTVTAHAVRAMRRRGGLTQQEFGSLLGFSFVTVNRWENSKSSPGPASSIILHLFERALKARGRERLVADLRAASGSPLGVVEELARSSHAEEDE